MADDAGRNGQEQDDLQGTDVTEDRVDAAAGTMADGAPETDGPAARGPVADGDEQAADDGDAPSSEDTAEGEAPEERASAGAAADVVDRARKAASSVADGARKAAGALGQETVSGWSAMRAVSQAKRAHGEAADRLAELKATIEEDSRTLAHRREVEATYDELVAEQTAALEAARHAQQDLSDGIAAAEAEVKAREDDLEELKTRNERDLRPYKNLADSSKSTADDAGRTLSEAKKAAKTAEGAVRDLTKRRDSRVATANKAADNARQRLTRLQSEISSMQRDPDADPKQLSSMKAEATAEMARLSRAQDDAKAAPGEAAPAIEAAEAHLADARAAQEAAEKEADTAKKEAKKRARDLDREQERARAAEADAEDLLIEAQKQVRSLKQDLAAQEEAESQAQATLDEAADIVAHPEETDALSERVADNSAAAERQEIHVQTLADTERDLRQRTLRSRVAFILVVVAAVIVLAMLFMMFSS